MPILLLFTAYNLLLLCAAPLMPLYLLLRWFKGKVVFGSLRERLGFVPRMHGAVWLHGASVGETLSVGSLIDQLEGDCLVTSVTAGGKKVAALQTKAQAVSLLPYDFLPCMLLAFMRIRPKALVVVENDWWPNLLMLAYLFDVPVHVLSARIHEKSFAKYKRMGWFLRPLLSRAQHIYVQTQEDKKRFVALGITRLTVLGDLKAQNVLAKHSSFTPALRHSAPTLLVGSLHPGELQYYTKLFVTLKKDYPDLRMILAPRHFHWQGQLIEHIESLGFSYALWSEEAEVKDVAQTLADHDILLVCTLGKLFSLYSHADIFYLGGTFVPIGGHNLLEPAVFGLPAIVGPYYENTKRVADELATAGGVIFVQDDNTLLKETKMLLDDTTNQAHNGQAARHWISQEAARTKKVLSTLKKALYALVIIISPMPTCQANPLFMAIQHEKPVAAVNIIRRNVVLLNKVDPSGNTALHLALAAQLDDVVFALLESDRTLANVPNKSGETPLHVAVWNNQEVMVQTLLKCGANPNASNEDGSTPLHIASDQDYTSIIKRLRAGGAQDQPDAQGRLPQALASNQAVARLLTKETLSKDESF